MMCWGVAVHGGQQLAVMTGRSGEHFGLLRRAHPADLKWLQLTEAVECEGGTRQRRPWTGILTHLRG